MPKPIPDVENVSWHEGTELSKAPIEMKSGDWVLKLVPWIGGRIISMDHLPSGNAFESLPASTEKDLDYLFSFSIGHLSF